MVKRQLHSLIERRLSQSPSVLACVQDLKGHTVDGASWEGFVVEQVAASLPT